MAEGTLSLWEKNWAGKPHGVLVCVHAIHKRLRGMHKIALSVPTARITLHAEKQIA